jgi:hypothetical protein
VCYDRILPKDVLQAVAEVVAGAFWQCRASQGLLTPPASPRDTLVCPSAPQRPSLIKTKKLSHSLGVKVSRFAVLESKYEKDEKPNVYAYVSFLADAAEG